MRWNDEKVPVLGNSRIAALLIGLSFGCLAMLAFRSHYTGETRFLFMVWNLFLAWLPYAASVTAVFLVRACSPGRVRHIAVGAVGVLWLLFFPNATYLTTDFVHVVANRQEYIVDGTFGYLVWFDVVLFFFFAWCGIFLGFLSFYQFHRLVAGSLGEGAGWLFVAAVSLLGGYGVFLGRIVRLNSWDALVNLSDLMERVVDNLHKSGAAFSLLFSFFVAATYAFLYFLQHAPRHPRRRSEPPNATRM